VSGQFFTLERHGKLYVAHCKLCGYRTVSLSEREAIAMMYNHYREVHEAIVYRKQQISEKGGRSGE
jgi:transcription elongation factor Elf1